MEADSWLLTWTTYGTWLPGDERGFVGNVVEEPANDAIQSANVGRAADASRRVSSRCRLEQIGDQKRQNLMLVPHSLSVC